MFGNLKGEVRVCPKCMRSFDILRKTAIICACGTIVKSKEFNYDFFIQKLKGVSQ